MARMSCMGHLSDWNGDGMPVLAGKVKGGGKWLILLKNHCPHSVPHSVPQTVHTQRTLPPWGVNRCLPGVGQGAADDSAWARGQAWALYGFTMMHRETKKPEYLERAVSVAEVIMAHPNLPSDKVPYWDFGATPGDSTPRDASAAAVMASALVELSQIVGGEKGAKFLEFARVQMLSLSSPAYLAAQAEKADGHSRKRANKVASRVLT